MIVSIRTLEDDIVTVKDVDHCHVCEYGDTFLGCPLYHVMTRNKDDKFEYFDNVVDVEVV